MKQAFKMTGNDQIKTSITVHMDTGKSGLTRWENKERKARIQNRVHALLRDMGYDVNQIKLGKK